MSCTKIDSDVVLQTSHQMCVCIQYLLLLNKWVKKKTTFWQTWEIQLADVQSFFCPRPNYILVFILISDLHFNH